MSEIEFFYFIKRNTKFTGLLIKEKALNIWAALNEK